MPIKVISDKPCQCGSRYIVNKKHNLCYYCNYKRLHEGKSMYQVQKEKKRKQNTFEHKAYVKSKKYKVPTGEARVFQEIWDERKEHRCSHCYAWLGNVARSWMFSHIKPKSTHPELRLDKDNIELHCYECHYAHEFQGVEAYQKRKDLYRKEKLNFKNI